MGAKFLRGGATIWGYSSGRYASFFTFLNLPSYSGIEFLNESSSEDDVEEEEEKEDAADPSKPGIKRKRLSTSISSNGSRKRRRTASEGSSMTGGKSSKRQRTSSLSSVGRSRKNSVRVRSVSETSANSSKVKKTADEWMTDKILTEEDFKRIEDKRLEWMMQGLFYAKICLICELMFICYRSSYQFEKGKFNSIM